MSLLALTHLPSPNLEKCQLTFLTPELIDYARALAQHAHYCAVLERCGARVTTLDLYRELPDCVFVEDTAVVLDEVAVMASMGAPSRRAEPTGIAPEISKYRPIQHLPPGATLEGGDVLRVGKKLLIGLSSRTNRAGVNALSDIAHACGYEVRPMAIERCLHLKTACTALPDGRLLINPALLDTEWLRGFEWIEVPPEEPAAADVALVGEHVCVAAEHPRTMEKLQRLGFSVHPIALSEFAKAEGGVTCLSIIFESNG